MQQFNPTSTKMRSNAILIATTAWLMSSTRAWLPNANFHGYIQTGPGRQQQHPFSQQALIDDDDDDDIDIVTGSQFHGLQTFANLPYVNALSDQEAKHNQYDIAVLGAPFDTSTSGRPGARYGPGGIRIGSQRMFPGATSMYTGAAPLASWAKVVDVGDVGLTWFDNTVALRQLDKAHRVSLTRVVWKRIHPSILLGTDTLLKIVSGRQAANASVSKTPRILTLGGDHTTTLSALRSTYHHWGDVSVIHFDSHIGQSCPVQ